MKKETKKDDGLKIETTDQLLDIIEKYGADRVFFRIPTRPLRNILFLSYTSSSDEQIAQMAYIDEEKDTSVGRRFSYKIRLQPFNPNYASQRYYTSDLVQLARDGVVKILLHIPVT